MNDKEKKLVLELCKFQKKDKSELTSLINEGYATPSVLGELFFNRMASIAHGVLEDAQLLGKVNREFRNSLTSYRTLNIEKNKSFLMCLKYITSILAECENEYVMLKGAYLCSAYPKGYRTSNDIDLLVNPKSISKIEKILLSEGFKQGNVRNGSFIAASRSEILSSKMLRGETVPFIKQVDLPFMKYLEIDINFSMGFTRGLFFCACANVGRRHRVRSFDRGREFFASKASIGRLRASFSALWLRSCLNFFQKRLLHCPRVVLDFLCSFLSVFPFFAVT